MGLDLTFYELKDYTANEHFKKEHTLVEVAYFSNATAMLLVEWLYRNHSREIIDKHQESYHYIQIYEDDIWDIIHNLTHVLTYPGKDKGLLALHYFPTRNTVSSNVNSCAMYSDDYYLRLYELKERLEKLVEEDDGELSYGKCFFYNISW